MTLNTRASVSLGLGAALLAAFIVSAAGGALAQNTGGGQAPPAQQRADPGRSIGGPGGRGGPMGALGVFGPALRQLNLTEDQRQRLRGIAESHRDEMRVIAGATGRRMRPCSEPSRQEPWTKGRSGRAAEVAAGDADMAIAQARIYSEACQVLTPEQQAQLKKLQAEMKEHGRGGGAGETAA